MKRSVKMVLGLLVIVILATACATPPATEGAASRAPAESGIAAARVPEIAFAGSFDDVNDRDWLLVELRAGSATIAIDRDKLAEEGLVDLFSLRFDREEGLLGGAGAPNRYSAPFTLEGNHAMSVSMMVSTHAFMFREPEELQEHDYFAWLQAAHHWNLAGESLELYSRREDGSEAVLVFRAVD